MLTQDDKMILLALAKGDANRFCQVYLDKIQEDNNFLGRVCGIIGVALEILDEKAKAYNNSLNDPMENILENGKKLSNI